MMKKIKYTRSRLREKILLGAAMIVWRCLLVEGVICVCIHVFVGRRGAVVSAFKVVIVVLGLDIH